MEETSFGKAAPDDGMVFPCPGSETLSGAETGFPEDSAVFLCAGLDIRAKIKQNDEKTKPAEQFPKDGSPDKTIHGRIPNKKRFPDEADVERAENSGTPEVPGSHSSKKTDFLPEKKRLFGKKNDKICHFVSGGKRNGSGFHQNSAH